MSAAEAGQTADLCTCVLDETGDEGRSASRTVFAVVKSDQRQSSAASGVILWGARLAQANIGSARRRFSAAMNESAWR
jgi:hypothetical protein